MLILESLDSGNLFRILDRAYPDSPGVPELLAEYLDREAYDRSFASRLIELARSRAETWDLRRLAALMLQHQVLLVPDGDLEELDRLFVRLRLKKPGAAKVRPSLVKEGFSTTDLEGFAIELRRKLARHQGLFRRLDGRRTAGRDLEDFLHLAKLDCKLDLARYLVAADEVVDRILRQVATSRGAPSAYCQEIEYLARENKRTLSRLPDFEAEIVRRLWASPMIYWVSEKTGSEINSLVEYPLGTVVLVVKPPGSHMEIELKRAGRRGGYLLGVRFRDEKGYLVANMHRLDGGSSAHFLRHDATAAARFSQIYRLVHGGETRHSKTLAITGVYTVPVNGRQVMLFEYFSRPEIFGDRFPEVQKAMKASIGAFEREWGSWIEEDLPGDLGLAVEFLSQVPPAQGVQLGTTSYRLDLVARYLSPEGPERYFAAGLGRAFSPDDARRFADEILAEVLGLYEPPDVEYLDQERYVEAALRRSANRRRADRVYLALAAELGKVWGTLLGVRGFSNGESFVARNVGLRTVWEGGRWTVELHFMDHDNLQLAWGFHPTESLAGMLSDERYLFGTSPRFRGRGTMEVLGQIYRAGGELEARGHAAFNAALAAAYRKTRAAVDGDRRLGKKFKKSHVERSRNWDRMVASYLGEVSGNGRGFDSWKGEWKAKLGARGYGKKAIGNHLAAFAQFGDLLARYSFLYSSAPPPRAAVTKTMGDSDV